MAISRSQTGKTVKLKLPKRLHPRMIRASSPMEKVKKKTPFLPSSKKNFVKYKGSKAKVPLYTADSIFKKIPDVK